MFTGLVESTLRIEAVSGGGTGRRITLDFAPAGWVPEVGDSMAISGVCLTASAKEGSLASFDAVPETLSMTTLGDAKKGDLVNVERALAAGGRVGGHFVQGHADAIGSVRRMDKQGTQTVFEIDAPADFIAQVIPTGSVAVDGVSLTVVDVRVKTFT